MEAFVRRWLFDPVVGKYIFAFFGVLCLFALVKFSQKWLGLRIKNADMRYRIRKMTAFMGYLAGLIFIASIFSDRLRELTVVFGIAGAGIAFALQEVIVSIAGWIALSFGNFYKVGDRVQLGGIIGDVIDMGVLRTTLMETGQWIKGDAYNGRIVRISNSFVFKEPVFNYSADFPFVWDEIRVPVKFGCDSALAKNTLRKIAQETTGSYVEFARDKWKHMVNTYRIEDAAIEPQVFLSLDENWMEFTLRYIVDYKNRRITKDKIFEMILTEFEKSQGRLVLAATSLEIAGIPSLDIRITEKNSADGRS